MGLCRYRRMVTTLRGTETADAADPWQAAESKAITIENDLRGTLRNFGLKVGMAGTVKFETRIGESVGNSPELAALVEPLLVVRCGCFASSSSSSASPLAGYGA